MVLCDIHVFQNSCHMNTFVISFCDLSKYGYNSGLVSGRSNVWDSQYVNLIIGITQVGERTSEN